MLPFMYNLLRRHIMALVTTLTQYIACCIAGPFLPSPNNLRWLHIVTFMTLPASRVNLTCRIHPVRRRLVVLIVFMRNRFSVTDDTADIVFSVPLCQFLLRIIGMTDITRRILRFRFGDSIAHLRRLI